MLIFEQFTEQQQSIITQFKTFVESKLNKNKNNIVYQTRRTEQELHAYFLITNFVDKKVNDLDDLRGHICSFVKILECISLLSGLVPDLYNEFWFNKDFKNVDFSSFIFFFINEAGLKIKPIGLLRSFRFFIYSK